MCKISFLISVLAVLLLTIFGYGEYTDSAMRTIVIEEFHGHEIGVRRGNSIGLKDKELVLTFDDGPKAGSTERILDILQNHNVKANFFLVGQNVTKHSNLVNRIVNEGHTIGYHSQSHPRMKELSVPAVEQEISKNIEAVEKALKDKSKITNFFRYPHLSRSEVTDIIVQSHDLIAFDGDFMAPDWEDKEPQELHDILMAQIKNNGNKGIIIMHDVQDRTVEYLKLVLQTLKEEDYKIVHLAYDN